MPNRVKLFENAMTVLQKAEVFSVMQLFAIQGAMYYSLEEYEDELRKTIGTEGFQTILDSIE